MDIGYARGSTGDPNALCAQEDGQHRDHRKDETPP